LPEIIGKLKYSNISESSKGVDSQNSVIIASVLSKLGVASFAE